MVFVLDEESRKKLFEKISKDPFANYMGIKLLELGEGYSKLSMKVTEEMLNFHNVPHGGAIFALADAAFAAGSNSHNNASFALTMCINYRRPVKAGTILIAECEEESVGKSTGLYRIKVITEDGKLVASCQGTVFRTGKSVV